MSPNIYTDVEPEEDESHQAISSYFLGPRAENYEYFKKNILEILERHRDARLDYFPKDGVRLRILSRSLIETISLLHAPLPSNSIELMNGR